MEHHDVHRNLGRHDAQIEAMKDQINRMHVDLSKVIEQLQTINHTLSEARGGWKTLMAVAGFTSATTAATIKVLGMLIR
jgi:predicted nuclease with TOPRIM domain